MPACLAARAPRPLRRSLQWFGLLGGAYTNMEKTARAEIKVKTQSSTGRKRRGGPVWNDAGSVGADSCRGGDLMEIGGRCQGELPAFASTEDKVSDHRICLWKLFEVVRLAALSVVDQR